MPYTYTRNGKTVDSRDTHLPEMDPTPPCRTGVRIAVALVFCTLAAGAYHRGKLVKMVAAQPVIQTLNAR